MTDLTVTLPVEKTMEMITDTVDSMVSSELIDTHSLPCGGAVSVFVMFVNKVGDTSLTVTVYPEGAYTRVHFVVSKSAQRFFDLERDARCRFENLIEEALEKYIISRCDDHDGAVL